MVSKAAPHTELDAKQPSLKELIQKYRISNSVEGKSHRTVSWYTDLLILFLNFLVSKKLLGNLSSFNITIAREYVLYLLQRKRLSRYPGNRPTNLSPKTIQCHVRTLKAFSSWLFREGFISGNVLSILKIPKAPVKIIEILIPEEIRKIFHCINKKNPIGCVTLLY